MLYTQNHQTTLSKRHCLWSWTETVPWRDTQNKVIIISADHAGLLFYENMNIKLFKCAVFPAFIFMHTKEGTTVKPVCAENLIIIKTIIIKIIYTKSKTIYTKFFCFCFTDSVQHSKSFFLGERNPLLFFLLYITYCSSMLVGLTCYRDIPYRIHSAAIKPAFICIWESFKPSVYLWTNIE